jgi:mono/diheme cytochrome c family protein
MKVVKTKKMQTMSRLLLTLMASTVVLGGCGGGVFFDTQDPATTTSTASPTPAPTPGATPTPTPAPTPGATPTPTPVPTPGATPTPTPVPTPTPSAGTIGKSLWANNCASCHGGVTGKYGADPAKILNFISSQKEMRFLGGTIGATEANQIATYAASPGSY